MRALESAETVFSVLFQLRGIASKVVVFDNGCGLLGAYLHPQQLHALHGRACMAWAPQITALAASRYSSGTR